MEKPNDFVKRSKVKTTDNDLNKSQSERLVFWEQFNQVLVSRGKPFNVRKATTDHWYDVAIGSSEAHIAIDLINKDGNIVVELYISNNKEVFDDLFSKREEIEQELGFNMTWDRLNNKKASRIKYYIQGLNFDDHSNYEELMRQAIDTAVKMREVFKKYL